MMINKITDRQLFEYISRLLCLLVFGITCLVANGQSFAVSLIPEALKSDANAVIRSHITEIEVKDEKRATITVEQVITCLNRNGANAHATFGVVYDDFDRIEWIEGAVYDAAGNRVRKLKEKEIRDASASGSSFASDTRVKIAELNHDIFPYTAVFRYRKSIKGLFSFPAWVPQDQERLAVEFARLDVFTRPGLEIKYKGLNIDPDPEISEEKELQRHRWRVEDLPAIESEVSGPPWREYTPVVYIAPLNFEIEGYKGSNGSWKEFGAFYYALNAGRQKLPEELQQEVWQMTENLPSDAAKIRAVYRYMQENTRYVSVQLGIGGWQTFKPDYVFENGYGDCKALSNYVQSMLSAAGITAYPVLIRAGDEARDILPDFSANQFNHVILCVPTDTDTTWLECTASHQPSGYLGRFTEDRYGLMTTPEGGVLVRTPSSPPESNLQIRNAEVLLDKSGQATVEVEIIATGYQQDALAEGISQLSSRDQEKWLRNSITAKSFDLTGFEFNEVPEALLPTFRYAYKLKANNWASASGSRFFLAPNQLGRSTYIPEKLDSRSQPVVTQYPYLDTDTIRYKLPEGYVVEAMPEMPMRIESAFGTYLAHIDFMPETGELIYTRSLQMNKVRRPAEEYDAYRQFRRDVVKADKVQIVLSGKS